jgi:glycerophosphoryl diester phosphodiesterase
MTARQIAWLALLYVACREPVGPPRPFLSRYPAPLHVAHRGGGDELPEHTLYAYDFSLAEIGTDVLEIDVRRTCDGALVIAHDDSLARTLGLPLDISQVTLDFLRAHEVPFPIDPEPGRPRAQDLRPVSDRKLLRIPTLDEVLDRYRNCLINLEVKEEADTELVIASLKERARRERGEADAFDPERNVCFASFHDRVGRRLQQAFPGACHTYPQSAAICAVLPRWPGGPLTRDAVECPEDDLFTLPDTLLSEGLLQRLHGMGRPVHAYTVNDRAGMNTLLDRGVDGIMTDRPRLLREVMHARGLPARGDRAEPLGPCVIRPVPLAEPAPGARQGCTP